MTGAFDRPTTRLGVLNWENGDRVTLGYDKAKIKDAPNIAEDGHLSPDEEQQLYRYYGLGYGTSGTNTAQTTYADTSERGVRDRDLDGDVAGDRRQGRTVVP